MTVNLSKYIIKEASIGRKFVTQLNKSGAILPVLLLEGTVTGGRTYQAYKRDGVVEARERFTEEFLAAIFWLFGATIFGKLLDKFAQKFLKIPKNMPDVGRDAVKTPFNNFVDKVAKLLKMTPEKKEAFRTKLARFSVGKTFTSLAIACMFIGMIVPKLNQAITKHVFGKNKQKQENDKTSANPNRLTINFSAKDVSINAVENFKASKGKGLSFDGAKNPSFKAGADSLLRIVQNFEENAVWKLLGTDVGTVSGRTINARNKDERVEILFRDISAIYFYCFSVPQIVSFMNKKDTFSGLNTRLNPMSAMTTHNYLVNKMPAESVLLKNFKELALGKNIEQDMLEKFFGPKEMPKTKKYLFGLIKKQETPEIRTITLEQFNDKIDELFANNQSQKQKLKSFGQRMSELMQSPRQGVKILTETQVEDILKGGAVREPEFLSNTINEMHKESNAFTNFFRKLFGKKPIIADSKPLTDPYRYISQSTIESERQQILDYVQSIIKDSYTDEMKAAEKTIREAEALIAKTKPNTIGADTIINNANELIRKAKEVIAKGEENCVVTAERMLKINKRNLSKNGLFMGLAMGVSAAFLSTILPKIQYYITYLRTGKNSFPGVQDIRNESQKTTS